MTTDPYGTALRSLSVSALADALDRYPDLDGKNAAIRDYLRALHPDARVCLWWH